MAFSPVRTAEGALGIGLAPLAVKAEHRRQGIGSHLVQGGLESARQAGYRWVVVLGPPEFYGRLGFSAASSSGLIDAYGGGGAFQVMALQPGGIPVGQGLVRYGPEFDLVS